jgi:CSLREA domain-containing protein
VKKVVLLFALAVSGLLALPAVAAASNINVNTFADESTDDAFCSLREAVEAANENSHSHEDACVAGENLSQDTIHLQAGVYTLSSGANEDANATGDLDITSGGAGVNIVGTVDGNEVPTTTINTSDQDRIFDLRPDGANPVVFSGQGLILANGAVTGTNAGGAIRIGDADANFGLSTSRVLNSDAGGNGGAISFPNGTDGSSFEVSQVEFAGNNADDEGGAIWVDLPQDSEATVERSTFVGNTAGTMGGAAYIESEGSTFDEPVLQFENSTLTENVAGTGGGALAFDFGAAGTAWFRFTTIANNSTPTSGGGGAIFTDSADQFVLFQGGVIVSRNVAGNFFNNCAGPGNFQSLGYNLESANSCGLDQGTDLTGVNPLLAPRAFDETLGADRTTETMALYAGSQAINRIPPASCSGVSFDQRMIGRPVGTNCDVGAFEAPLSPPTAPDADADGVVDPADNCIATANPDQANSEGDILGNACDADDDNDAVLDASDNCPTQAGPASNGGCPVAASTPPGTSPPTAKKCKKKKKKRPAEVAKKKKKCKKKKRK